MHTQTVVRLAERSDNDSLGSGRLVVASDVWLGVGAWDSWSSTEMSLGFSVLGGSEEEGVGSYSLRLIKRDVII